MTRPHLLFIHFISCKENPDCSHKIGSTYEQFLAANASLGIADDEDDVQRA